MPTRRAVIPLLKHQQENQGISQGQVIVSAGVRMRQAPDQDCTGFDVFLACSRKVGILFDYAEQRCRQSASSFFRYLIRRSMKL